MGYPVNNKENMKVHLPDPNDKEFYPDDDRTGVSRIMKEMPEVWPMYKESMPHHKQARKDSPIAEGVLWYFPNALAEVAKVSKTGNDQHNPGQPMHWSRDKSSDHADCILRHLIDAGKMDSTDGMRHTAKVAWRALALLQEELEREEGYPLPRNAKKELNDRVPTNPLPASDLQGSLFPVESEGTAPRDVARDSRSLRSECSNATFKELYGRREPGIFNL